MDDQRKFCTGCGEGAAANANFCERCGHAFDSCPPAPARHAASPREGVTEPEIASAKPEPPASSLGQGRAPSNRADAGAAIREAMPAQPTSEEAVAPSGSSERAAPREFVINQRRAHVYAGMNIHSRIATLPKGTRVNVEHLGRDALGHGWWQILTPDGNRGFLMDTTRGSFAGAVLSVPNKDRNILILAILGILNAVGGMTLASPASIGAGIVFLLLAAWADRHPTIAFRMASACCVLVIIGTCASFAAPAGPITPFAAGVSLGAILRPFVYFGLALRFLDAAKSRPVWVATSVSAAAGMHEVREPRTSQDSAAPKTVATTPDIRRSHAEVTTCWFCGSGTAEAGAAVDVPMYRDEDVRRATITIGVPRCTSCRSRHRRAARGRWYVAAAVVAGIASSVAACGVVGGLELLPNAGVALLCVTLLVVLPSTGPFLARRHATAALGDVKKADAAMFAPAVRRLAGEGWVIGT